MENTENKKTFTFTTWSTTVFKGSVSVEAANEEEALRLLQDHTEVSGDPMDVVTEDNINAKIKSHGVTIYNDDDDVVCEWGDL